MINQKKLTDSQWQQYEEEGYLILKNFFPKSQLIDMQKRIDAIMMGEATVPYDSMLMQLDSNTGSYGDLSNQTSGFKGPTLNYRKIESLEFDSVFLECIKNPLFKDACRRSYGKEADIACYRAMFMNKPAGKGTFLPWHQDSWQELEQDPSLTVYIALDPATRKNGCVQLIPKSHKAGALNPDHHSGFLTDEQAKYWTSISEIKFLELDAGDVALLHNKTLHSSDKNNSHQSRRAFSICYMDNCTKKSDGSPTNYSLIFGKNALELEPSPA